MSRAKEAPYDFLCPYRHRCPELEGCSTQWVWSDYQRRIIAEHEYCRRRDEMAEEIDSLIMTVKKLEAENDQLRAENKMLHQRQFKAKRNKAENKPDKNSEVSGEKAKSKKRGAPKGHPSWARKEPSHIDRVIEVDAPCVCPHCQEKTDLSKIESTSYIQEDIVIRPQTVVTSYQHASAYCPGCRRQVIKKLEGELPFSPIGPQAKAAALYLRHETKLPYRKVQRVMSDLFGMDFAASATLGFEKRARQNADPLYENLILKMRSANVVHADESYWREDGKNQIIWYAGNEDVAVFHIDASRSAEAAKRLLGDRINGLLVTDAYAGYNSIEVEGRQSCLAHLLRKAKDIRDLLAGMKCPDKASAHFCNKLIILFKQACALEIPVKKKSREKLTRQMLEKLDAICKKQLAYPKAETLRKRLIPSAREYGEVFAFIKFGGPPTNNHAERALRPLVIFRKVCMGSRSSEGSKNIGIFSSLGETAKLQGCPPLEMFQSLLKGNKVQTHDLIFNNLE